MDVFLGSPSAVVLVIWGLVFEVAGFLALYLFYRATVRDEEHITALAEVLEAQRRQEGSRDTEAVGEQQTETLARAG